MVPKMGDIAPLWAILMMRMTTEDCVSVERGIGTQDGRHLRIEDAFILFRNHPATLVERNLLKVFKIKLCVLVPTEVVEEGGDERPLAV